MTQLEMAHAQIEQQARVIESLTRDLTTKDLRIELLLERITEVEEANQSLHVALATYQTRHGGNDDQ